MITSTTFNEVLFIDRGVSDVGQILRGLRPHVEAIVLRPDAPAARQMAEALRNRRELEAVHIMAHGAPGRVSFAAGDWTHRRRVTASQIASASAASFFCRLT